MEYLNWTHINRSIDGKENENFIVYFSMNFYDLIASIIGSAVI